MDPVTLGIAAAMAVGGGALSAKQASEQNKAIGKSMQSNRKAAVAQQTQLSQQAGIERSKRLNEANMIRSRLRVTAGEAGVGMGGSFGLLTQQADYDAAANDAVLRQNLFNNQMRLRSDYNATNDQISSQSQNSILAALMGGVGGMSSGLSIAGAFPGGSPGAAPAAPTISGGSPSMNSGLA